MPKRSSLPVITEQKTEISLFYSLLTGIGRRAVRSRLHPPPHSLSLLESAIYLETITRTWPKNRDSSSNQRITFPATVPHSLPNSLKETVTVTFRVNVDRGFDVSLGWRSDVANPKHAPLGFRSGLFATPSVKWKRRRTLAT
jgi:hypothetical protein